MASKSGKTEIGKSLDDINARIKTLQQSIRGATENASLLDKALKLDPNNVQLAAGKYEQLGAAVRSAGEKIEAAKKQKELLDKQFKAGEISQDTYNRKIEENKRATERYRNQLKLLETQLAATRTEIESLAHEQNKSVKTAEKLKTGYEKFAGIAKKAAQVIVAFSAAIVKSTKEMAQLGVELTGNAKKYDTTVEKLQEQAYLYQALTGDANAYTNALQAMNSVMAQILSGRGQSQLKSLAQIGLSKGDLMGLSTSQAYDKIFEALRNTEDQATATAVAVKLFGDAGAYVSEMAQASEEEYEKYAKKFAEVGGVSEETAKKMAELSADLMLVKYAVQASGAEIVTNLLPLIKTTTSLVVGLTKGLAGMYNAFGGVGTTIILLSAIITARLIPSIVKSIIQTKIDTDMTWKQVIAKVALKSAVGGVAVGLVALAGVTAIASASAVAASKSYNKLTTSINGVTDAAEKFEAVSGRLNANMEFSAQAIEEKTTTSKIEGTFIIKAEGDTQVSGETAREIGKSVYDQVNTAFGGIIA